MEFIKYVLGIWSDFENWIIYINFFNCLLDKFYKSLWFFIVKVYIIIVGNLGKIYKLFYSCLFYRFIELIVFVVFIKLVNLCLGNIKMM